MLTVLGLVGLVLAAGIVHRGHQFVGAPDAACLDCHQPTPHLAFEGAGHADVACSDCHVTTWGEGVRLAASQWVESWAGRHSPTDPATCSTCHSRELELAVFQETEGHVAHLTGDDPLECVECHTLPEESATFAVAGCQEAGCHADTQVRLAGMEATDPHCNVCHGFLTPMSPEPLGGAPVFPGGSCLDCHDMTERFARFVDDEDPHGAVCGACHNPHADDLARDANRSCQTAACHPDAKQASIWHLGLDAGVYPDCTRCHTPHGFTQDAGDCSVCHTDPAGSATGVFPHAAHVEAVECRECHGSESAHGGLTVSVQADCMTCHHAPTQTAGCDACHAASSLESPLEVALRLQVATVQKRRDVAFQHSEHVGIDCLDCHSRANPTQVVECGSCHQDHHTDGRAGCAQCHAVAPAGIHTRAVHTGCRDAGCHAGPDVLIPVSERATCLVCHVDQVDHEADGTCASCHLVAGFQGGSR